MLVTAHNRGPDAATLHLLPTLWFRNTWSWGDEVRAARSRRPSPSGGVAPPPRATTSSATGGSVSMPRRRLLFCENETNNQRLFGAPNASPYVKDGINDFVVGGARTR